MSDSHTMLCDAADRLFADLAADQKLEFAPLWRQLDEAGFPSLLVSEAGGGFGGDWPDAVAVLRLAGYHALPAPLAEAMIAGHLLHGAGVTPADGMTGLAASCEGRLDGSHFTGRLTSVAWGRIAETIVAVLDGRVLRVRREAAREIQLSYNPTGEPRDTLYFDHAAVVSGETTADPFVLGALARTAMIAGALDAALARSHLNTASIAGPGGWSRGRRNSVPSALGPKGLAAMSPPAAPMSYGARLLAVPMPILLETTRTPLL
jgi:acyl-CoA dehydrogenase